MRYVIYHNNVANAFYGATLYGPFDMNFDLVTWIEEHAAEDELYEDWTWEDGMTMLYSGIGDTEDILYEIVHLSGIDI